MKNTAKIICTLLFAVATAGVSAELNPLFQNNALLQCGARVPVWGTARDGEKITVTFASQKVSTVAANGAWKVWLKPMKPNATPQTLTVSGDTTCVITNVLVGEVWVASGQSNMERQLGLRPGQKPIADWEREVAAANYPEIRQFYVPQTKSFTPQTTVKGDWSVCSPETAINFTAVGYFFARDLFAARHVPVGIIHSSWGGTPAEAWTSEAALQKLPDFAEPLAQLKKLAADPELARRETMEKQEPWYQKVDPGSKPGAAWSAAELATDDWKTMTLPTYWENAGYPDFDGIFWFRRTFELPENWDGGDVVLHLGAVDDNDTTWVNGEPVGATMGWSLPRVYRVPASVLKRGENVIAVRVLDTGGNGGLYGGDDAMRLLFNASGTTNSISLAGPWRCKQSVSLKTTGWPPGNFSQDSSAPTVLYNGMIAPLLPYAMRGVIWYQGESNVGRERQYQTLFPAMIADWRKAWDEGDFPFLFVQVAPYRDLTPEIHVEANLLNALTNAATATVNCQIVSPEGKSLTQFKESVKVAGGLQAAVRLESKLSSPVLWSPESPKLYKVITTVSVAGKIVDRQETSFGIRTVAFDPNNGFLLNGKRYELQGVCIHQDWPGVGVAVPDSLQCFRVSRLKEMGCNAIRTAHNPPAPGFLDACDQLGILVMDEHRLPGGDTESLSKWDDQIRRDRNHPCVAIWCLGNEERGVEDTPQGANVARSMQNLVKRLDPTRPVTYAAPEGNVFHGINSVIEVRGWNYYLETNNTDRYHAGHPTQPEVCTEQGSIVSTRGIYANDWQHGYISSYDTNWPGWTPPSAIWLWNYVAARPWLSGVFVWAGFDYGGEPSPNAWPNINSQFGILDRCGFPKDTFYYYQSWWQTNPVLHLLPHWNWPGREGQDIRVVAYSNCKQVELLLNGVSLGRQAMAANSDLVWQVKYAPGTLSAKGFDDAGKVIAETKVETTGDATQIQLTPDRKTINADGEDVAVFTVSALDAQGRVVPLAQNKIASAIEGAGKIIGVGNGDPASHEPDTFAGQAAPQWSRSLFNGLAQIIVQSTKDAGEIKLTATADGLTPATTVVKTQPCVPRPSMP